MFYKFLPIVLFVFIKIYSTIPAIISIPKTGTLLTGQVIYKLTGKKGHWTGSVPTKKKILDLNRNNQFFYTHIPYHPHYEEKLKRNNLSVFFTYRDPRDQVVSFVNFIRKFPAWDKHTVGKTNKQLITELIKNARWLYANVFPYEYPFGKNVPRNIFGVRDFFQLYLPWMEAEGICVIRFENLVGPKGGGDRQLQLQEIRKIATHLNINYEEAQIEEIADTLFGNSPTFYKGQIGTWKLYFDETLVKLFNERAEELLILLDYD